MSEWGCGARAGPSTSHTRPAIASSASSTPVPPAREWAEQALGVPTFRDLARALAAVEPDVVVLASPPSTHRPLAELSLAAGCHVVVEKPLALALPDAVAIAAASPQAGRIAMVAQNYRFRRQPRALHDLVMARALGRLLGIRISCRRDLRDAWISRRDWRGKMPYPYLLDMAIHHVDLVRMITGQEVAEVDARGWNVPDAPFKHDPTVAALLTLADGTPIAYEGTWAEPLSETSWNGDWELLGERGRATWSGGVDDALLGVVRFGGIASARRGSSCRHCGGSTGAASSPSSGALLPPASSRSPRRPTTSRAWPRFSRSPARPTSAGRCASRSCSRREDRALPGAVLGSLARGGARRCPRRRVRDRRDHVGPLEPALPAGRAAPGPAAREHLAALVAERGLAISALSCHANPLHPDAAIAAGADEAYRDTVRLAAELGVATVITFSGCPGQSEHSLRPSWVTCSWPDDFPETLAWQWDERVLPYWAEAAAFADGMGFVSRSSRIRALSCTTPRRCCGSARARVRRRSQFRSLGPVLAGHRPARLRNALGDAIFHVHAKDTGFHEDLLALNGVLEPIPGNRPAERSWIFRSVGAGHPVEFWRALVDALGAAGYDGALSIEHEDPLLSQADGLELAVTTLRAALGMEA